MAILLGQKAPDFKLFDTNKEEVTLRSLGGKNVVLLFFPFAFTGTCTAELCSVRDNYALYDSFNAEVIGISVDSVFCLRKYKEEQNLNFRLLSDFNKEACIAYDVLYETFILNTKGVAKRSAFIIDSEGIVRFVQVLENASDLPDFKAIQDTLALL